MHPIESDHVATMAEYTMLYDVLDEKARAFEHLMQKADTGHLTAYHRDSGNPPVASGAINTQAYVPRIGSATVISLTGYYNPSQHTGRA